MADSPRTLAKHSQLLLGNASDICDDELSIKTEVADGCCERIKIDLPDDDSSLYAKICGNHAGYGGSAGHSVHSSSATTRTATTYSTIKTEQKTVRCSDGAESLYSGFCSTMTIKTEAPSVVSASSNSKANGSKSMSIVGGPLSTHNEGDENDSTKWEGPQSPSSVKTDLIENANGAQSKRYLCNMANSEDITSAAENSNKSSSNTYLCSGENAGDNAAAVETGNEDSPNRFLCSAPNIENGDRGSAPKEDVTGQPKRSSISKMIGKFSRKTKQSSKNDESKLSKDTSTCDSKDGSTVPNELGYVEIDHERGSPIVISDEKALENESSADSSSSIVDTATLSGCTSTAPMSDLEKGKKSSKVDGLSKLMGRLGRKQKQPTPNPKEMDNSPLTKRKSISKMDDEVEQTNGDNDQKDATSENAAGGCLPNKLVCITNGAQSSTSNRDYGQGKYKNPIDEFHAEHSDRKSPSNTPEPKATPRGIPPLSKEPILSNTSYNFSPMSITENSNWFEQSGQTKEKKVSTTDSETASLTDTSGESLVPPPSQDCNGADKESTSTPIKEENGFFKNLFSTKQTGSSTNRFLCAFPVCSGNAAQIDDPNTNDQDIKSSASEEDEGYPNIEVSPKNRSVADATGSDLEITAESSKNELVKQDSDCGTTSASVATSLPSIYTRAKSVQANSGCAASSLLCAVNPCNQRDGIARSRTSDFDESMEVPLEQSTFDSTQDGSTILTPLSLNSALSPMSRDSVLTPMSKESALSGKSVKFFDDLDMPSSGSSFGETISTPQSSHGGGGMFGCKNDSLDEEDGEIAGFIKDTKSSLHQVLHACDVSSTGDIDAVMEIVRKDREEIIEKIESPKSIERKNGGSLKGGRKWVPNILKGKKRVSFSKKFSMCLIEPRIGQREEEESKSVLDRVNIDIVKSDDAPEMALLPPELSLVQGSSSTLESNEPSISTMPIM